MGERRINYFSRSTSRRSCLQRMEVIQMAYVISEECVACGTCSEECPVEAIKEGEPYVIDEEKCTDCGSCSEVCPTEAIAKK